MKRLAAAVVLVVGFAVPAMAQTNPDLSPAVDGPHLTRNADFGEHKVSGDRKPGGITWTNGKRAAEFDSLMTVRISFNSELQRSVDSL